MAGRSHVRRPLAGAAPIVGSALLVLVLVVLPSMGSRLVPAAVLAAPPAAAVVHLLGDEVAPAGAPAPPELRSRALVPGDPRAAVAVLVASLGLLVAAGAWLASPADRRAVPVVVSSVASGRSPPTRLHVP